MGNVCRQCQHIIAGIKKNILTADEKLSVSWPLNKRLYFLLILQNER